MNTRHLLPALAALLVMDSAIAQQNFTQNVNITSSSNATNLTVTGPGGVVFKGETYNGGIPASGDGVRLMWYPKKSAFRVGMVWGGVWDDHNIGEHSMGVGGNSLASGFGAIALGSSSATGHQSFSAGWGSTASGAFSSAMGVSTAAGAYSFAAAQSVATGHQSVALQGGTALGNYSVAIGSYATSTAVQSVVVGQFNEFVGDVGTPAATDPVFVVGTGTGAETHQRKNGFAVLRNGTSVFKGIVTVQPGGDIPMYTGN